MSTKQKVISQYAWFGITTIVSAVSLAGFFSAQGSVMVFGLASIALLSASSLAEILLSSRMKEVWEIEQFCDALGCRLDDYPSNRDLRIRFQSRIHRFFVQLACRRAFLIAEMTAIEQEESLEHIHRYRLFRRELDTVEACTAHAWKWCERKHVRPFIYGEVVEAKSPAEFDQLVETVWEKVIQLRNSHVSDSPKRLTA